MSRRAYDKAAGLVDMSAEPTTPPKQKKYGANRELTAKIHQETSLPPKGIEQYLNHEKTELLDEDEIAVVIEWRDRFLEQQGKGTALEADRLTVA